MFDSVCFAVRLPADESEESGAVKEFGALGGSGMGGYREVQSLKCVWNDMHGRTHVGGVDAIIWDEYWIKGLRYCCTTEVVGGIVPIRGDVDPTMGVDPPRGEDPTMG